MASSKQFEVGLDRLFHQFTEGIRRDAGKSSKGPVPSFNRHKLQKQIDRLIDFANENNVANTGANAQFAQKKSRLKNVSNAYLLRVKNERYNKANTLGCPKLRRFALQHWAAGDLRRFCTPAFIVPETKSHSIQGWLYMGDWPELIHS